MDWTKGAVLQSIAQRRIKVQSAKWCAACFHGEVGAEICYHEEDGRSKEQRAGET